MPESAATALGLVVAAGWHGHHLVRAISARHLTKTYQMGKVTVQALDDVSLEIQPATITCILGRSGSGKSTLLRQLGLLDQPSRGRIWINGQEVTRLPEHLRASLRLSGLGYVFQEYALLPELTAAENVYLPAMMAGQSGRRCRDRAAELLELVELVPAPVTGPGSCPAASSSAWRSRGRWSTSLASSSPTSRRPIWIRHRHAP